MEAQFQTEMNLALSELAKVKDLNFLRKITKLLKERPSAQVIQSFEEKTKTDDDWVKKRLTASALASEEDIKAGRVNNREEVEEYVRARLGL